MVGTTLFLSTYKKTFLDVGVESGLLILISKTTYIQIDDEGDIKIILLVI